MIDNVQTDTTHTEEEVTPEIAIQADPAESSVSDHASADSGTASSALVGKLIVKRSGALTDVVFPVNPPTTIGRFDPAVGPIDIDLGSLPEGAYVSRKHAQIDFEDGVWKIKDLGSSNGTYLLRDDFERVEEGELADGTEIALGNARFVFQLHPGE